MKSPVPYFGGKARLARRIVEMMPEHKIYVEPFGGAMSVLLAKEPSNVEVYNDLDGEVVNFFRMLQNPKTLTEFLNRAWASPYSREEYYKCRELIKTTDDPVEKARCFFVLARYGFAGHRESFGISLTRKQTRSYHNALCNLVHIQERLSTVCIECVDFRKILNNYDTPDTLFYLDPPYVPETRKSGVYKNELTNNDHVELVDLLNNMQGKFLLSGYNNDLYNSNGWYKKEYKANCSAAARTRRNGLQGEGYCVGQARIECLWSNFEL